MRNRSGGRTRERIPTRSCEEIVSISSGGVPNPPSPTRKKHAFCVLFSVLFACGEFYCFAVIFGFRRVICTACIELQANKISLKPKASISLSRSENITPSSVFLLWRFFPLTLVVLGLMFEQYTPQHQRFSRRRKVFYFIGKRCKTGIFVLY